MQQFLTTEQLIGLFLSKSLMTVEATSAKTRPPNLQKLTMITEGTKMNRSRFHDYARMVANSEKATTKQKPADICTIIPDHSLLSECNVSVLSPNCGLMYECDPMEGTKALLSPCVSEPLPSPNCNAWKRDAWDQSNEYGEERIDLTSYNSSPFWTQMDGPPIQDYLSDMSNSALNDIREELSMLASPEVKHVDAAAVTAVITNDTYLKHEAMRGPTLAQLNDQGSVLDSTPLTVQTLNTWTTQPNTSITGDICAAMATPGWTNYKTNLILTDSSACSTPATVSPALPKNCSTFDASQNDKLSALSQNQSSRKRHNSFGPTEGKPTLQQLLCGGGPVALSNDLLPRISSASRNQQPEAMKKPSLSPGHDSNSSNGSMERKWEEIRDYIDEKVSADRRKDTSTEQGLEEFEPLEKKIKQEPEDSDDDDDGYSHEAGSVGYMKAEMHSDYDQSDDDLSDVDSDCSYSSFIEDLRRPNKKEKRFFWQYNTQSKGPKGKRLCKSVQVSDPHCLADFEDPVFQRDCANARYKHNGRARKGDGNDITPNPWKLFQIGNELMKLNKKINKIGSTTPVKSKDGVKSKSRREKNKFASRACRLKKKAQHEAYKLKLFGLEEEHHQLMEVLLKIKSSMYKRIHTGQIEEGEGFVKMYDKTVREHLTAMIAGHTTEYVNSVLEKVADGDRSGGINAKQ